MNLLSNLTHLFQPSGAAPAGEVPVVVSEQDALIAEWRGQVAQITALTRNPQADSGEITSLMLAAYRSGRHIEHRLGSFPDTLGQEKQALVDAIARLWLECKMLMVDLLLGNDMKGAKIMRMRMSTMCRLGEMLGCLNRLPGHDNYEQEPIVDAEELDRRFGPLAA